MDGKEKRLLKDAIARLRQDVNLTQVEQSKVCTCCDRGHTYSKSRTSRNSSCVRLQVLRCAARLAKETGITKSRKKAVQHFEKYLKTEK